MNELSTTTKTLPQTIEEKTAFVLFGADALNAYRKKLKAVKEKFGISSEQYKQIQLEAQETAENLLLFSVDIGKEMQKIDKASGGDHGNQYTGGKNEVDHDFAKTSKAETIRNMGFTEYQARDFQTLAKHPETVQKAIEDARKEDRIVTRQDVFHQIAAQNETKRQEAARELREAKHRVEDFGDSKVVSIGDAKQNSDDKKLIFKEFMNEVQKANEALRHVSYRLDLEIDQAVSFAAIKAADKVKQIELQNELNHGLRTMLHIQKVIEEAINEK